MTTYVVSGPEAEGGGGTEPVYQYVAVAVSRPRPRLGDELPKFLPQRFGFGRGCGVRPNTLADSGDRQQYSHRPPGARLVCGRKVTTQISGPLGAKTSWALVEKGPQKTPLETERMDGEWMIQWLKKQ